MNDAPRASRAARALTWLRFILGLAGAFYVFMTFSLFVHEVLGHGVAWTVFGARRLVVSVGPGFAGYVRGDHSPAPFPRLVITFAGIGANTVAGLLALLATRWRKPTLTPAGLALFWVATTQLGQALGYTLMGLIFNQGDAENLDLGRGRFFVVAVIFVGFLALARWSCSTIARFIREHFESHDLPAFRRTFIAGFTIPFGAIVLAAPGLPGRSWATVLGFDAGILVVLLVGTFLLARRLPQESDPKGHPITWGEAAAWSAAALATFLVTSFWFDAGITVTLR